MKLQYSRWIRRMSKTSNNLMAQAYHAKRKKRSDQVLYWFEKFVDLTHYNNNKNRIRLM